MKRLNLARDILTSSEGRANYLVQLQYQPPSRFARRDEPWVREALEEMALKKKLNEAMLAARAAVSATDELPPMPDLSATVTST